MRSQVPFACAAALLTLTGTAVADPAAADVPSQTAPGPSPPAPLPGPAPAAPAIGAQQPAAAPAPIALPPMTPAQAVPADGGASESSKPARKRSKFHAAMALGPGYFHATSGASDDIRTFSAGSVSGQLVLGARVNPHFVIGGAYLRDQMFALSAKDERIDGDEPDLSDVSFTLSAFGVFADVYLRNDSAGPHLQFFLGPGSLGVRGTVQDVDEPSGVLFSVGAGYDFAISEDIALGALFRLDSAQFDVTEVNRTDVDTLLPALLLSGSIR